MSYSMYLCMSLATFGLDLRGEASDATPELSDALAPVLARIQQLVASLRGGPIGPLVIARFEKELKEELRELGRGVTERTYNHLAAGQPQCLPDQVYFEA